MKNIQISLVGEQPGGAKAGLRVSPSFDQLVLLHGDSKESRKAAHDTKVAAEEMMVSPEAIVLVSIDPFGMDDVFNQVMLVRKKDPNANITVNLSGGTNIMASAALLGCFTVGAEAFYIKFKKGEIDQGPLEERVIRLPIPKVLPNDVKGSKLRVLRALLDNRGNSLTLVQRDVARALEMKPQLVTYHVKQLAKWRLVTVTTEGRTKNVTLTNTGCLFARVSP